MTVGHLSPQTKDAKQIVSMWPTEGTRKTFITPSWCDRTTWIQQAIRVVDEIATNFLPFTQYDVSHPNLIDTYHGKVSQEDFFKDATGNSYRVIVKVNDAAKTEQDPHLATGGDYTINYATGRITFLSALGADDVVKVTYHYATTSLYTIKPATGKILKIKSAEAQFSKDIVITDSIRFQPYGYVQVFAPTLWDGYSPPGPYPANTLIPLGDATVYKTMSDYINEANGAYPEIAQMGGGGWRGCAQGIVTFPWNYIALTDLISSYGMEIRIFLEHDAPFTGAIATATFYCFSENE